MGMKHLESTNVLYELAKGLGTMHPDGSDSYFPTSRMPMGLLQYMVNFFNAKPGHTHVYVLIYSLGCCVQVTIVNGYRVCIFCLGLKFPNYSVGQCGVKNLQVILRCRSDGIVIIMSVTIYM